MATTGVVEDMSVDLVLSTIQLIINETDTPQFMHAESFISPLLLSVEFISSPRNSLDQILTS